MTQLAEKIKSRAHGLLGDTFEFREGQLEAIEAIVTNVLSNTKQTVLEAPTGSGKSLVALLAAYVLFKEYEMKSYILVSDLSLFDQYVADIDKLKSRAFGYIKGKENYTCEVNKCKVSQAMCSLQGMSVVGAMHSAWNGSKDFSCVCWCKYAHDYLRAVKAPITLMTYQLYFIQRNYVEDVLHHGKNNNFPMRSLVICDEAHKICDICQSHFAPQISAERPSWMKTLDNYCYVNRSEDERISLFGKMMMSTSNDELLEAVVDYMHYVESYCSANNKIRASFAYTKHLQKKDRLALAAGNMARQEHCKLEDMVDFVNRLGSSEHIVKTVIGDGITLNFVFDNLMLEKYFHKKSSHELLMSATIGDFNEYAMLAGLDKSTFKSLSMPSTFDFSKSPIYVSQNNKMSVATKDTALKEIGKQTIDICRSHAGVRGIIQTGSYANSEALKSMLPDDVSRRCFFYTTTAEKKLALDSYLATDDGILVGPTLIEGLNFPDGLCRFQVCIKVPYAFLGSEYVRKKMKYVNGWYEYDVINKICQGIGRGVRHKDDWCETYILDGCIMNLLNKLEDIPTLSHRFKLYE